jgi:hypothetical protein
MTEVADIEIVGNNLMLPWRWVDVAMHQGTSISFTLTM